MVSRVRRVVKGRSLLKHYKIDKEDRTTQPLRFALSCTGVRVRRSAIRRPVFTVRDSV